MNAKNLIAAVSLFVAAGSALADQTYPFVEHTNIGSTKARAEVVADLKPASGSEFVEHKNAASGKTRADQQPVSRMVTPGASGVGLNEEPTWL